MNREALKTAMIERFRKPNRTLNWISCLDVANRATLQKLQKAMTDFYANFDTYYTDIEFAADTWSDCNQIETQDILLEAQRHQAVLEIGCGKAYILKSGKIDPRTYTGLDFSSAIMALNRESHPEATFHCIEDISKIPVATSRFDFVFSHYVLEHCVFPNLFLEECARILRPGGILCILCPDFLGAGRLSSQRAGLSAGTGREKLYRRKVWDALVTGYDNRIRIPLHAFRLRGIARKHPQFFINIAPTCATDSFLPDVDAVYLTFADEIRTHLSDFIEWHQLESEICDYSKKQAHIYLKGHRKAINEE